MNKIRNFIGIAVFMLFVGLIATGCYFNDPVDASQRGVKLDGGRITEITQPGVQNDLGFNASLKTVSCSTITIPVTDDSVATADTQIVGVAATIQVRRKCDDESVKTLMEQWTAIAGSDDELKTVIQAVASQGIKVGTRAFTLDTLLSDRTGLASQITTDLNNQVKFPAEIVSVVVNNISPSASYLAILQQKADYTAQTSAELQRQALIKQKASNDQLQQEQDTLVLQKQLDTEKARTTVNVEIASRAGKVTAASYQVYQDNPAAYELERLTRLKDILNGKTIYFLQPGQLTNLFLGNDGQNVVPVTQPSAGK